MSQTQTAERTRFTYSADFMFWMLGWTVHNFADTFVQNQSTIDVLARVSTVLCAIALPLAWNSGRRWHVAFIMLLIITQVMGGPPTPRERSTPMLIASGCLVGLGLLSVIIGLCQRYLRAHPPAQSAIVDA